MDAVSYSHSAKQAQRIKRFINNPDSVSGIITVPSTIAAGETITIPAGRIAVLPNVTVEGTLVVDGEVFIPSGSTMSGVMDKVPSTDNAIVRFNGTTGDVQDSLTTISDTGAITAERFVSTGAGVDAQLLSFGGTETRLISRGTSDLSNKPIAFLTGTTERFRIESTGNVLTTSGTFGYGTGAGGTVTQATSKSTSVTLNKSSGLITTNAASLAAGATINFVVNNTTVNLSSVIVLSFPTASVSMSNYRIEVYQVFNGSFAVRIINISAGALAESLPIQFNVLQGVQA